MKKKRAREPQKSQKKDREIAPACLERKPPSCFWTILRTDFERKHGKIVPAVSQRPNFLLPFSVSRFPNRFFCFFLFLVAASSRSMLLQLLQRLHLFFFWNTQSEYYPPPACCCGTIIILNQKSQNERQRRTKLSLSLSLVSKKMVRLCVFVARKKQRHHLLLTRSKQLLRRMTLRKENEISFLRTTHIHLCN